MFHLELYMDDDSVCINITQSPTTMDDNLVRQMTFIYNAIQDGWSVVKKKENYIFVKKHEGKKEIFSDDYLKKFITENFYSKK